jgi:hypothetical protein
VPNTSLPAEVPARRGAHRGARHLVTDSRDRTPRYRRRGARHLETDTSKPEHLRPTYRAPRYRHSLRLLAGVPSVPPGTGPARCPARCQTPRDADTA